MERRIFGHMVTRNEATRYLAHSLLWHVPQLDGLHIFDDQSDDATVELIGLVAGTNTGTTVAVRDDTEPSFLANEAEFRAAAWRSMERELEPVEGDWILCIDADEFVMSCRPDVELHEVLHGIADELEVYMPSNSTRFHVEEVWVDDGFTAFKRIDGYWDTITAERFVAYQPGGDFAKRPGMGGGSVPSYAKPHPKTCTSSTIVHVGYLSPLDRIRKYDRYSSTTGHSTKHVRSIMATPELRSFDKDLRCSEIKLAPWRLP